MTTCRDEVAIPINRQMYLKYFREAEDDPDQAGWLVYVLNYYKRHLQKHFRYRLMINNDIESGNYDQSFGKAIEPLESMSKGYES